MTADQFKRVKEIFLDALNLPEAERHTYIRQRCDDNDELIAEVTSLLAQPSDDRLLKNGSGAEARQVINGLRAQLNVDPTQHHGDPLNSSPDGSPHARHSYPGVTSIPNASFNQWLSSNPSSRDVPRFSAGTLIAGRYKILDLLGRGGMGEVYRAEDLRLGQIVALKFLPPAYTKNEKWLARFHQEVRMARQVTHANVCRVYDLGEFEGDVFISMEYIDGENLANLLLRIGRFPQDRAIQLARQLCAGLSAAHEKGVLHRDLKPANVMIDGRGQVKITDFGLAAPEESLAKNAGKAGTPAYMSPEQFVGEGVSVRSDIYSLGLVFFEMFTGRPAFEAKTAEDYKRLHRTTPPRSPATLDHTLDSQIERLILRMLEKEPRNRPSSVMIVAASLPGGDPLAAALAAGETPSPEMVAAAGGRMGLTLQHAVIYAVIIAVGLTLSLILASTTNLASRLPLEKAPAVLVEKDRELLHDLGFKDTAADEGWNFSWDPAVAGYIESTAQSRSSTGSFDPGTALGTRRPSPLQFWYRQSERLMVSAESGGVLSENDPPMISAGMIWITQDLSGRLLNFEWVPKTAANDQDDQLRWPSVSPATRQIATLEPRNDHPPEAPWPLLFQAAGLDMSAFREISAEFVPPHFADTRRAWEGAWPDPSLSGTPDKVRIEAASYNGKPVSFQIVGPWGKLDAHRTIRDVAGPVPLDLVIQAFTLVGILCGGVGLVWWNMRSARGDRAGAFRLLATFLTADVLWWFMETHHVPSFIGEVLLFVHGVSLFAFPAAIMWVFYMAMEPVVRRIKPEAIITWSRILSGQIFDPGVGRDVLVGVAVGVWMTALGLSRTLLSGLLNIPVNPPESGFILSRMLGFRWPATLALTSIMTATYLGLGIVMVVVVLGVVLRWQRIVPLGFLAIYVAATTHWGWGVNETAEAFFQFLAGVMLLIILGRYGVVSLITALAVLWLMINTPISLNLSAWHSGFTLTAVLTVISLAVFGFTQSTRRRLTTTLSSTNSNW